MNNRSIEDQILANIQSGKVKMRPRWFFLLKTILAIVAGTVLFVSIVFIGILIGFIQHETGAGLAVGYGLLGWFVFLKSLPWALIATAIVFVMLLLFIAKRSALVYQRPLIYALIGVVVLVVAFALIISATPLYPAVFTPGVQPQGFFISNVYQYETSPLRSVHRGLITVVANNGFLIQNAAGLTSTVIFAPGVAFNPTDFRAGQGIVVFGSRSEDGIIEAFGVQKL